MKRFLAESMAGVVMVMLVTASGAFAQYVNPCDGDIAKFCGNLQPGKGQIAECLSQNEAQLSFGCRNMHLSKLAEAIRQAQQACESDSSQFCGRELQQPGIQLLTCLRLNEPSLTPGCKTKLFEALEMLRY